MAIVNCPECQGKVSTNASTCVHCGCKLSFCPECGAVLVGEVSVCSECGFQISGKSERKENIGSTPPPKADDENGLETVNKVFEQWELESKPKGFKIASICLKVFDLILSVWVLIRLRKLNIFSYQEEKAFIVVVLILMAITSIASYVLEKYKDMAEASNLSMWAKHKNIDLKGVILCYLNDDFNNRIKEQLIAPTNAVRKMIEAKTYEDQPIAKSQETTAIVLKCLMKVASCLCTYIFIIKYVTNVLFPMVFLGQIGSVWDVLNVFQYELWWLLAVSVGLLIVRGIYTMSSMSIHEKNTGKWFSDNFKEYSAKYDKYITENEDS